ncbi:MAG: GspH/FimT family pseudopilin [Thiogranum sp.]|nr:GspH/FimT family pseudopilin [Thiogranum sp.]
MKNTRGFTLVELVITLAVGAILLTVAIPGMRDVIINNRIATQTNELVTAFNLARMEAIRRGTQVSVCASANKSSCSGNSDWSTGWIVFVDANATGTPSVSTVLRTWGELAGSPTVSGDTTYLRYLSSGHAKFTGTPPPYTRTIEHKIDGCIGTQKRSIAISAGGRVSTTKLAC